MISFLFKFKGYIISALLLFSLVTFYFVQKSEWENKLINVQKANSQLTYQLKISDANNTTIFSNYLVCKNDLKNLTFTQKWSRKISSVKRELLSSPISYIYSQPIKETKGNASFKQMLKKDNNVTFVIQ